MVRHKTEIVNVVEPGQHQVPEKQATSLPSSLKFPVQASEDAADSEPESCEAESASSEQLQISASKPEQESRSRHEASDHREGSRSVSTSPSQTSQAEHPNLSRADSHLVADLVKAIMTKAAADSKNVAAETKEAEKLAASAAKSPTPKDDVALKKGSTGEGSVSPSNALDC